MSPTNSPSTPPIVLDRAAWIAYETCDDCNGNDGQVWVAHPDGSADHRITPPYLVEGNHPDLSHDGTQIAFDAGTSQDSAWEIHVANVDGSNLHVVGTCRLPDCIGYQRPAWSPDDKRIAIARDFGPIVDGVPTSNGIAILDVETGKVTNVTKPHGLGTGQDVFPRWSPDGRSIVFWRDRVNAGGSEDAAVFVIGSDGSNERQLTPWAEEAGDPDWSPDGRTIVYCTHPPHINWPGQVDSELVTIRPDGTARTVITTFGLGGPKATQPRWLSDGSAVVYMRTTPHVPLQFVGESDLHIWAIAPDGSSDTAVLTTRQIYSNPSIAP